MTLTSDSLTKSSIFKRSIVIDGHKTSLSLEDPFWSALKEIAKNQEITLSSLVGEIDNNRDHRNLSSAIRLFVLRQMRPEALPIPDARKGIIWEQRSNSRQ